MPWTKVQSGANATNGSQTTILSVTLSSTSAGNLLVVHTGFDASRGAASLAVSDNQSQSYSDAIVNIALGRQKTSYVVTVAGVTSVGVTPGINAEMWIVVEEWSPPAGTTPAFDVGTSNDSGFNTANPQSSGTTGAIAATTDLVLVNFANQRGLGAACTLSTPSGYTLDLTGPFASPIATSGGEYVTAYNTSPSAGGQSATTNITTAGSGWEIIGIITTWKAVASAGTSGSKVIGSSNRWCTHGLGSGAIF